MAGFVLFINVFSMTDGHDSNDNPVIVDLVNYMVITDPDPVSILGLRMFNFTGMLVLWAGRRAAIWRSPEYIMYII
jgi:hypothetical protein